MCATDGTAKVIGIAGLARNPGSPGRAFALTETALGDALARHAEHNLGTIRLTHAAGNRQLVLSEDLEAAKTLMLDSYFGPRRAKATKR